MERKTITLELDAYERLRAFRRPGESFSAVVRRAVFPDAPPKGTDLLAYFRSGGSGVSNDCLNAVAQASKSDLIPDNPWA